MMRGLFHRKESSASRHSVSDALSASTTIATVVAAAPSPPPSPFHQNSSPSLEQRQQRPRSGLFSSFFQTNGSSQTVASANLTAGKEKHRHGRSTSRSRSRSRSPLPTPSPSPSPNSSRAHVHQVHRHVDRSQAQAQIKMPEPEPYRQTKEKEPLSPTSPIPGIEVVGVDGDDNDNDGFADSNGLNGPEITNGTVDRGFGTNLGDSDDDSDGRPVARSRVPVQGAIQVGMAAGKLAGDFLSPLPWVGPVVELVATIVVLCQNVGRNKRASVKLGEHCQALLFTVQKGLNGPRREEIESSRLDLEHVLNAICNSIREWSELTWMAAFGRQESIADKIRNYHTKIDSLCTVYQLTLITDISNWQEEHTQQMRRDHAELVKYLCDAKLQQEINQHHIQDQIGELREDFEAFYKLVQNLLLDRARTVARDVSNNPAAQSRTALEANLAAIYRATGELPPNLELTEGLVQMEPRASFGSGMFDIFRGTCFGDAECVCAFKVVRRQYLGERTRALFNRQLRYWKEIQLRVHEARQRNEKVYILPLVGAIYSEAPPRPFLCFVSPWMEKGNALTYVSTNRDVDKLAIARKIALGIKLLHTHEPPLAHGNIRASNILMDTMGDPHISDFGLMRIVDEDTGAPIATMSLQNALASIRWFPPEYLGPDFVDRDDEPSYRTNGHSGSSLDANGAEASSMYMVSTKSDIFMYGMTILEIMTGEKPFATIRKDLEMTTYRMRRGLPVQPANGSINNRLWALLVRCWATKPADRPDIHEVLTTLQEIR